MKKLIVLFLSIVLLACPAAAPAASRTFTSLRDLQNLIENHAPSELTGGSYYAQLEGTVTEVHWCGRNTHWQFTLQVDEPGAIPPLDADSPQVIIHFRLHLDQPPFQVGDRVTVYGSLNSLYSSVIIPWILAETINGSDDF